MRVSVALAPTLIFTLVIAGILYQRFHIPEWLYGALLLYAVLTTLLPSFVLKAPFDVDLLDDRQLYAKALPSPQTPLEGGTALPDEAAEPPRQG